MNSLLWVLTDCSPISMAVAIGSLTSGIYCHHKIDMYVTLTLPVHLSVEINEWIVYVRYRYVLIDVLSLFIQTCI